MLFLCQHLEPRPWQARGLEEVTPDGPPLWSDTLCGGNLLQEVLEGSLEPNAETSGHSGAMRVLETFRVTQWGDGEGLPWTRGGLTLMTLSSWGSLG